MKKARLDGLFRHSSLGASSPQKVVKVSAEQRITQSLRQSKQKEYSDVQRQAFSRSTMIQNPIEVQGGALRPGHPLQRAVPPSSNKISKALKIRTRNAVHQGNATHYGVFPPKAAPQASSDNGKERRADHGHLQQKNLMFGLLSPVVSIPTSSYNSPSLLTTANNRHQRGSPQMDRHHKAFNLAAQMDPSNKDKEAGLGDARIYRKTMDQSIMGQYKDYVNWCDQKSRAQSPQQTPDPEANADKIRASATSVMEATSSIPPAPGGVPHGKRVQKNQKMEKERGGPKRYLGVLVSKGDENIETDVNGESSDDGRLPSINQSKMVPTPQPKLSSSKIVNNEMKPKKKKSRNVDHYLTLSPGHKKQPLRQSSQAPSTKVQLKVSTLNPPLVEASSQNSHQSRRRLIEKQESSLKKTSTNIPSTENHSQSVIQDIRDPKSALILSGLGGINSPQPYLQNPTQKESKTASKNTTVVGFEQQIQIPPLYTHTQNEEEDYLMSLTLNQMASLDKMTEGEADCLRQSAGSSKTKGCGSIPSEPSFSLKPNKAVQMALVADIEATEKQRMKDEHERRIKEQIYLERKKKLRDPTKAVSSLIQKRKKQKPKMESNPTVADGERSRIQQEVKPIPKTTFSLRKVRDSYVPPSSVMQIAREEVHFATSQLPPKRTALQKGRAQNCSPLKKRREDLGFIRNTPLQPAAQQHTFKIQDPSLEHKLRQTQQPVSKQGLNLVGALAGPLASIHHPNMTATSFGESGSGSKGQNIFGQVVTRMKYGAVSAMAKSEVRKSYRLAPDQVDNIVRHHPRLQDSSFSMRAALQTEAKIQAEKTRLIEMQQEIESGPKIIGFSQIKDQLRQISLPGEIETRDSMKSELLPNKPILHLENIPGGLSQPRQIHLRTPQLELTGNKLVNDQPSQLLPTSPPPGPVVKKKQPPNRRKISIIIQDKQKEILQILENDKDSSRHSSVQTSNQGGDAVAGRPKYEIESPLNLQSYINKVQKSLQKRSESPPESLQQQAVSQVPINLLSVNSNNQPILGLNTILSKNRSPAKTIVIQKHSSTSHSLAQRQNTAEEQFTLMNKDSQIFQSPSVEEDQLLQPPRIEQGSPNCPSPHSQALPSARSSKRMFNSPQKTPAQATSNTGILLEITKKKEITPVTKTAKSYYSHMRRMSKKANTMALTMDVPIQNMVQKGSTHGSKTNLEVPAPQPKQKNQDLDCVIEEKQQVSRLKTMKPSLFQRIGNNTTQRKPHETTESTDNLYGPSPVGLEIDSGDDGFSPGMAAFRHNGQAIPLIKITKPREAQAAQQQVLQVQQSDEDQVFTLPREQFTPAKMGPQLSKFEQYIASQQMGAGLINSQKRARGGAAGHSIKDILLSKASLQSYKSKQGSRHEKSPYQPITIQESAERQPSFGGLQQTDAEQYQNALQWHCIQDSSPSQQEQMRLTPVKQAAQPRTMDQRYESVPSQQKGRNMLNPLSFERSLEKDILNQPSRRTEHNKTQTESEELSSFVMKNTLSQSYNKIISPAGQLTISRMYKFSASRQKVDEESEQRVNESSSCSL